MNDSTSTDPLAWRPLKAPSLAEFEVIAAEAFARLPMKFRAKCDGVVIRVEDYATTDVLDEMEGAALVQVGGRIVERDVVDADAG